MIFIALLPIWIALLWYWYPGKPLPKGVVIDKLVVYKKQRRMNAYAGDILVKTYAIALGKNPLGHKQYEGDNRTPEGIYTINDRNDKSMFHKNLGISYPNNEDMAFAENQGKSAGGAIKIHGLRNRKGYMGKYHTLENWTAGCIAVTNFEIDELYAAVKHEAEIRILK